MNRLFLFLLCGILLCSCTQKNPEVVLSSRYIPPYNPGGSSFETDRELVRAYSMYEKRRQILDQKQSSFDVEEQSSSVPSEQEIKNKLNEFGISDTKESAYSAEVGKTISTDGMVNKDGVDLSMMKGAKFIDIDDSKWGPIPSSSNNQKKSISVLEKSDAKPLDQSTQSLKADLDNKSKTSSKNEIAITKVSDIKEEEILNDDDQEDDYSLN